MTAFANYIHGIITAPVIADTVVGILIMVTVMGIYKVLTFGKFFE